MTAPLHPPSLAEIEALARAALGRLPEPFRSHLGPVVLHVEDWPSDEQLAAVGLNDPLDLTGLYEGIDLGSKSVEHSGTMPDRIFLFRIPLLLEWVEDEHDLATLVTHVIVHEAGHHFGLSDEAMHAIEACVAD